MALVRLLLIADDRDGGMPAAQAQALADGLDPSEFAVTLVRLSTASHAQLRTSAPRPAADVLTIPVAARWRIDPRALSAISRLLGRERPDIVHTFGPLAGSLARWAAVLHRDELIAASLATDALDRFMLPTKLWQRYLANRTRLNIVSTAEERALAVDAGWPARHVHVAPLAIPRIEAASASATGSTSAGDRVLQTFDGPVRLAGDVELIAVAAPLEPVRRIKESIWAFDLLRSVRPNSRLLVVGRGPLRRDLEVFRDQQECNELVYFAAEEDAADCLAAAHVVWSFDASLRPSFLTLRAIAAGKATVASDTPGHRPYVVAGTSGFLVPSGARAAIAQATLRLLDDDDLRIAQAAAAARHMAENYCAAALIEEQTALYRSVLSTR